MPALASTVSPHPSHVALYLLSGIIFFGVWGLALGACALQKVGGLAARIRCKKAIPLAVDDHESFRTVVADRVAFLGGLAGLV